MKVERDYGSKFVDFTRAAGTWLLGLMPPKELAKDAGLDTSDQVPADADRPRLTARAAPGDEHRTFVDPDGHHWSVTSH